jgi:hypothetical protein
LPVPRLDRFCSQPHQIQSEPGPASLKEKSP